MDTVFWVGLGLGALVSVPLSITANLWTDKVRNFLDKKRRIRLSNTKSKEVRMYFFVRALREGDPTAKILLDAEAGQSLRLLILSVFTFLVIIFLVITGLAPPMRPYAAQLRWGIFLFLTISAGCTSWSLLLHGRMAMIQWRLKQFKVYETDIRVKWGDDAFEEGLNKGSQYR